VTQLHEKNVDYDARVKRIIITRIATNEREDGSGGKRRIVNSPGCYFLFAVPGRTKTNVAGLNIPGESNPQPDKDGQSARVEGSRDRRALLILRPAGGQSGVDILADDACDRHRKAHRQSAAAL